MRNFLSFLIGKFLSGWDTFKQNICRPCCCHVQCCCPPPRPPPHHHDSIALDVLDVLTKSPRLYLVTELRYPCHRCHPCCCRRPYCCLLPCHPSPSNHHHHEVDALDVLAKTPNLYIVPGLRYPCHSWRPCCCCPSCCCPPCRCPPPCHHRHEADALDELDALAKTPGLYLVPGLRYWVKYLVEKIWYTDGWTDRRTASFL